jgi:hypothetical protein
VTKYIVEIPDSVVECQCFKDAVNVAKVNQPSSIWRAGRAGWCIARFPWVAGKKREVPNAV